MPIVKKTSVVNYDTGEKRRIITDDDFLQQKIEEYKIHYRKAKKSFTENQAIRTINKYIEITSQKRIDKDEAMSSFSEVENCIKYLCKKNRLDTLTKFMDIVIENDSSCTITNMFFQRINED